MEWIYENGYYNTTRYVLGITGNNPLICIGINPSTAKPEKLDRTIESVIRICHTNNFDSWIMLNVYPQITADPNNINISFNAEYHNINLKHIESFFQQGIVKIWCAWGTLIEKRPFLINCLSEIFEILQKYNCQWITTGKESKNGHPHHPLYLKSNVSFRPFPITDYLLIQRKI
jgi:hypothetical protein